MVNARDCFVIDISKQVHLIISTVIGPNLANCREINSPNAP